MMNDYFGYVLRVSQKDKTIFKEFCIVGRKRLLLTFLLYKIRVAPEELELTINRLQNNMAKRFYFFFHDFYAHFIRGDELIIVWKEKVFHITADQSTWKEAVEYGRSLGIEDKQLDFKTY